MTDVGALARLRDSLVSTFSLSSQAWGLLICLDSSLPWGHCIFVSLQFHFSHFICCSQGLCRLVSTLVKSPSILLPSMRTKRESLEQGPSFVLLKAETIASLLRSYSVQYGCPLHPPRPHPLVVRGDQYHHSAVCKCQYLNKEKSSQQFSCPWEPVAEHGGINMPFPLLRFGRVQTSKIHLF